LGHYWLVILDTTQTRRTLRLAGIDAPESGMPHGQQAKVYLAALVLRHEVVATTSKQDRYGRTIATLKVDGNDIKLAMIQAGLAWHYPKYAKEQPMREAERYATAQEVARAHGMGLWRDECPVAPWIWRHGRKLAPVKMDDAIPTCF
jgi:endonuclease YncB( thermonuclease family)